LVIKVLNIIDARCNHEDNNLLCPAGLKNVNLHSPSPATS